MGRETDFIAVFLGNFDRAFSKTSAGPNDGMRCFVEMLLNRIHAAFELSDENFIGSGVTHIFIMDHAVSLVINIVVNMLLIPHLGAVGSAWASLATQSFMAVAQLLLSVRIFKLPVAAFGMPKPREIANNVKSIITKQDE